MQSTNRNPIFVIASLLIMSTLMADDMTRKTFTLNPVGTVQKTGDRTLLVIQKEIEPALLGLDGFSHVWVFWWFDRNDTPEKRSILQVHPRGNPENPLTGVFGTRSPVRPNLIAQTLCEIVSIKENVVEIEWIDAFDGTPIIDIKPYIEGTDVVDARYPGWLYGKKD